MIAGTFATLAAPADEPLEDYHDSANRTLDVDASHTYLDGHRIQSGMIAGDVTETVERVTTAGGDIDVEQRETQRTAATEWVADVDTDGWILAERTWPSDEEHKPDWPFSAFEVLTGQEIQPMAFDPAAFVERQRDEDREPVVEMTTVGSPNGTRINWGRDPGLKGKRANTGVALATRWAGEFVRLVVYASGYTAIWEPADMAPELVGRFVHEELIPIAEPLTEGETTEQEELRG